MVIQVLRKNGTSNMKLNKMKYNLFIKVIKRYDLFVSHNKGKVGSIPCQIILMNMYQKLIFLIRNKYVFISAL